jgi:transposase
MTPGTNRRRTIFGAIDLATGSWFYQVTRKAISTSFTCFCEQLLAAHPTAPMVAVVCDNVIIHRSKLVKRWLAAHPRLRVLHGARYSPHDNPTERIWGRAEGVAGQLTDADHPGPCPPGACLLSRAPCRADAGHRRTAQLTLAAGRLRAELQASRFMWMSRSRRAATVGVGRAPASSSSSTVTEENVDWSTSRAR